MRGADGGVALDVLHRSHARGEGPADVLDRGVALLVDELGAAVAARIGHPPQHQRGRHRGSGPGNRLDRGCRLRVGRIGPGPGSGREKCGLCGLAAVPQAVTQIGQACGSSSDGHRLPVLCRPEGAESLVVAQRAPGLAEQVHRRVPSTADQQQIAGDALRRADLATLQARHGSSGDPIASLSARHDLPGPHRYTSPLALLLPVRRCFGAGVGNGAYPGPRGGKVERCGVRGVVGGEHHDLVPGQYSVTVQIGPCRAGQHDAWPIVAAEHDRPLMAAGRDQDVLGPDSPDSLTRPVRRRCGAEVVGAALERQNVSVVEMPERRGALQMQDVVEADQLGGGGRDPLERRAVIDLLVAAEEEATGFGLLVDQHDPGSRPPGGQRGDQAGWPGADHDQVGVDVPGVVARGVRHLREPALSRDAGGHEPVGQLHRGGQQHRLRKRLLDLDQPIGILRPCGRDAPWAAELDAGGGVVDAVGQQG